MPDLSYIFIGYTFLWNNFLLFSRLNTNFMENIFTDIYQSYGWKLNKTLASLNKDRLRVFDPISTLAFCSIYNMDGCNIKSSHL